MPLLETGCYNYVFMYFNRTNLQKGVKISSIHINITIVGPNQRPEPSHKFTDPEVISTFVRRNGGGVRCLHHAFVHFYKNSDTLKVSCTQNGTNFPAVDKNPSVVVNAP